MTSDDQIKDEKLQYDINRDAAKISALSSGKIVKYELVIVLLVKKYYLLIKKKKKSKFTYSPLGKAFEKQIKQLKIKDKLML